MRLDWLRLRDFRSYEQLDFTPAPGLNVLVGPNGAGKTNVLEAIGYLSSLRSFRRSPDGALVRAGADEAVVRGGFRRPSGELRVEVSLPAAGRRSVLVNAKRPKRYGDVAAEVPLVAFLPDDLDVVKRGPALRREYLDDLVTRLSATDGADQTDYDRALRQRNALLRSEGREVSAAALGAWDEQVALAGARVLSHRLRLLAALTPVVGDAHDRVAGNGDPVTWRYEASWHDAYGRLTGPVEPDVLADRLRRALEMRRPRDVEQRTTTAGPHRDDPALRLGDRDARTQASQGEQRSLVLSLRLAAYSLLEERFRRPPVLLLDDVFSELDPVRGEHVVELLPRGQVFVTSARQDEVPVSGTRWHVRDGRIEPSERMEPT